jgi:hypothetical protein
MPQPLCAFCPYEVLEEVRNLSEVSQTIRNKSLEDEIKLMRQMATMLLDMKRFCDN